MSKQEKKLILLQNMIITIRAKVQSVVSKYLCVQLSKCNFCGPRTPHQTQALLSRNIVVLINNIASVL